MDATQVIGLCRSVMEHNVPEYGGIPKNTPIEEIAPRFVKICWRHGKEPVHDFRALVTDSDFNRLMDFVYIDSKESLDVFSSFVYGLGIKKIADWWKHKEMHEWIIPCIVRSQSLIPSDVWDSTPSTTNTNEAQHHWTNAQTGTKLTPVEALESRRRVDERVAQEIEMSLRTGILSNTNNEMSQRMARNSQRQSTAARKVRETRDAADTSKQLQLQIDAEIEKRRASSQLMKDLRAQLKATKSGRGKSANLSASSSGRVKTTRERSGNVPLFVLSVWAGLKTTTAVQTTVLPTQSDNVPSIPTAISGPSFDFDIPTVPSTANFTDPAFDSTFTFMSDIELTPFCRMSNTLTPYLRLIIVFLRSILVSSTATPRVLGLRSQVVPIPLTTPWTCMGSRRFSLIPSALPTSPPSLQWVHLTPCHYFLPLHRIRLQALLAWQKNQLQASRSRVVVLVHVSESQTTHQFPTGRQKRGKASKWVEHSGFANRLLGQA
ncbi:hypothetical protein DFH08DRAFT_1000753 [Mycena albidolilacea]|uniref:Uncharacterized protein n=1 Tax=Mycena albidolilacea TaxID=1033008 RepID=A0AAD7E6C6_9AGAR|nr:hypothetical protein DFH08DRAFT_1000753 [Mycena albidolilacea]